MRIVTNEKLAKRNRQIATYLFIFTLLILIGSFVLVNLPVFTGEFVEGPLILLQGLSLPVAFILTLVSVRMTNLWARPPRPEEAIPGGLKGLSKKSILYNYYHIPARHVLICPQGVFAIVTRWHGGKFSVKGDEWKTHQNAIARILSAIRMDGLGNPNRDAERAAAYVEQQLEPIAPDVDVQPLIVFVAPNAELEIENPEIPVLYADPKKKPNLTDYMREISRSDESKTGMPLTDEQIEAFEEATLP